MVKRILFIGLFVFVLQSVHGQQAVQYSLFNFNKLAFNPAYAGLDQNLSVTGVFRQQWSGLAGSPTSQNVNIHAPILFLNSGFGMKLENDALGAERNLTATLSYAYYQKIGDGVLSIGAEAGIFQKTLDGTLLMPPDLDQTDVLLPTGLESSIVPTANIGVYYKTERLQAGLSSSNILETSFDHSLTGNNGIKLKRNYFFIFAHLFELSNSISIEPNVLVKSDLSATQIDFSTIVYYNDNIFGGASLRGYSANTLDALTFLAGFRVSPKVRVAYAYDLGLSQINNFHNGSHELMLKYDLDVEIGKPRPAKVIYNPRFMYSR